MGAAAIGIALWRYEMRYNPLNPDWFNRDRKSKFNSPNVCIYNSPSRSQPSDDR